MIQKIQNIFNFAKKKSEYYLELDEDESLQDKFGEAKETAGDKLTQTKNAIGDKLIDARGLVTDTTDAAKEIVADGASAAKKIVVDRVNTAVEDTQEKADSAKKDVEKTAKSAKKDVEKKVESTVSNKEKQSEKPKAKNKKAATQIDANDTNNDSGASSWEQPFWVKVMFEKNQSNGEGATEEESTFATDNLLPTPTNYRRRPGPSLDKYRAMANETKTPRS